MVRLRYCFFAFLVLGLLITPTRGGYVDIGPFEGFCLSSFAGAVIGYFLLWYFLSKRNDVKILWTAMAGMFIFTLPIHIFNFEGTKGSFLEFLIHFTTFCLAFLIYRYLKNTWRYVCMVVVFAGLYWISVPGYHLWIHYLNHGTFTGRLEARQISKPYLFRTVDGDTARLSDWQGKTVLLDFWSKYCGYCWKALPRVQTLYEKYEDSPHVSVATVFATYEDGEWASVKDEVQKQYSFPVYLVGKDSDILKDWNIERFPVYVVLNEKSEMIYRGNLEGAEKLLDSHEVKNPGPF